MYDAVPMPTTTAALAISTIPVGRVHTAHSDGSVNSGSATSIGPVDTFNTEIPLDTFNTVIPVDTFNTEIPLDTFNTVIPVDTFNTVIPVDTFNTVIPVDPFIEDSLGMPGIRLRTQATPKIISSPSGYDPLDINNQYDRILKDIINFMDGNMELQNSIRFRKNTVALRAAAKVGNLDMVKHLVEIRKESVEPELAHIAARYGNTKVVEYLFSKYVEVDYAHVLVNAIKSQNLELIKYVYKLLKPSLTFPTSISRQLFWFYATLDPELYLLRESMIDSNISVILGDLLDIDDGLKDAKKYKSFLDGSFMDNEPLDAFFESNQELVSDDQSANSQAEDELFVEYGSTEVDDLISEDTTALARLLENNETISPKDLSELMLKAYIYAATRYGEEGLFLDLISNEGVKLDIDLLNHAASHGQMLFVRYLIEIVRIEPNFETLVLSISSLNLDLIKYLLYNRQMIDDDDAALRLEQELSLLDGNIRLAQNHDPLKSALKKSNDKGHIRNVKFNLDKNQLYRVPRYIDESHVYQPPAQRTKLQEHNSIVIPFLKSLFGYGPELGNSKTKVRRGKFERQKY